LLRDAVEGARCKVIARLSGHRNASGFHRMFELAMTASGAYEKPPVVLKHPKNLADLYSERISAVTNAC
jgi:hypothetical protein